jgi:hypothetical protein
MSYDEFKAEVESTEQEKENPPAESETKAESPATAGAEEPAKEKLSFWQTLKIWLNTPIRVSWSDIRKSRKK